MRFNHAAPVFALALLSACSGMSMPMMGHHAAAPAPAPAPAPAATPAPAPPPAPASAPAPAPAMRGFGGIVTAVANNTITYTGQDGASATVSVAPDAWVVKTRPMQASDIKPGDFVATANTNNPDGTGTSTELRVFPAGMHLGEGSYPMQAPNTTMTNATVSGVVSANGGRQLTVTYAASAQGTPAGTRTIMLPASVQVIQWYRVQASDVHVGERVRGRGVPDASGALVANFVIADTPPPATPAPAAH